MQSLTVNDNSNEPTETSANAALSRTTHSLFAKLTDAKKTLFGRTNAPDTLFSSATQNKALLTYVLSEPHPKLDVMQEFENNGALLNAVTDEGNTVLHLLARAEIRSAESIQIVDYLTKKGGCDANKQNDYGWTAGMYENSGVDSSSSDTFNFFIISVFDNADSLSSTLCIGDTEY